MVRHTHYNSRPMVYVGGLSPAQLIEAWATQLHSQELIQKAQELRDLELWIQAAENVLELYQERAAIQRAEPDHFYKWSRES